MYLQIFSEENVIGDKSIEICDFLFLFMEFIGRLFVFYLLQKENVLAKNIVKVIR